MEVDMQTTRLTLFIMLAMGAASAAKAQLTAESVVKLPGEIVFKAPATGPGPGTAVLYGDPSKPGVFVMRVRFPKGHKVTPRWRPDEWRTAVVLSGTFYYGLGDRWDESKLVAYPPGTFFSHPSKHSHFAWAKDGEVIIQFTAMGPTSVTQISQK
jgi:quercetin dioxygenase-like cupin family protein